MSRIRSIGAGFIPVLLVLLLSGCAPDVSALQEKGDVEGVIEALGHEKWPVREDAAIALGEMGDSSATIPLLVALRDEKPEVQDAAREGLWALLGSMSIADAVAALTEGLKNKAAEVREEAATALGTFSVADAALPLLAAMDDDDAGVRDSAHDALITMARSLPAADATAVMSAGFADESVDVRVFASTILGEVPAAEAVLPLIVESADPEPAAATAAEQALAKVIHGLPAAQAWGALNAALSDSRTQVRMKAATALGQISGVDVVRSLILATTDPAVEVADAARTTLSAMLDRQPNGEAVTTVVGAVSDPALSGAADAVLRQYLAAAGADRAAAEMIAIGAGDAWLSVALGVAEEDLAAETWRRGIQLDPLADIRAAAEAARNRTPVPGARAYNPSDRFHPTVIFGDFRLPVTPQSNWGSPTAFRFLELVVFAEEGEEVIETCRYVYASGAAAPSITRYRQTMTLTVIAAADGRVVTTHTLRGSNPRACGSEEAVSLTTLYGGDPDPIPWLEALINPPA